MNMTQLRNRVAVLATLASPLVSHAAAITLPAEITDAGASVAVVGAAVFAVYVGIKLYKWIARAL